MGRPAARSQWRVAVQAALAIFGLIAWPAGVTRVLAAGPASDAAPPGLDTSAPVPAQDLAPASARIMQFDLHRLDTLAPPETAPVVRTAPAGGSPIPRKLDLGVAERVMIERNSALAAARHQVDANLAAKIIASKRPNPQLTLGFEQLNAGQYVSPPSSATYTFRIDQLYERGGKRRFRTASAQAQEFASIATLADTARTQLLALRQAFTAGVLARENLRLAADVLEQYLKTENLTKVKVTAGDLAPLELYRVQSGRLAYQQAVLQAESGYANAVRDLMNTMGVRETDLERSTAQEPAISRGSLSEPGADLTTAPAHTLGVLVGGTAVDIQGTFGDRTVTCSLESLRTIARKNRPDLIAARYNADAAIKALRLAVAQRTRDVSVGTEVQRFQNYTDGVGQTSDNTVGIVFQVPLFLNNDMKAGIAQAQSNLRVAQAQVAQAELAAIRDVESAYQAYKLARRVRNLYSKQNLAQLDKMQSISAFNFRHGATSLFELLDAQRTYRQAYAAYNQARSDYDTSLWQLEAAIGAPIP